MNASCYYSQETIMHMKEDPLLQQILMAGPNPGVYSAEMYTKRIESQMKIYQEVGLVQMRYLWSNASQSGNMAQMLDIADRAIRLDPSSYDGYDLKFATLEKMGKMTEAMEVSREGRRQLADAIRENVKTDTWNEGFPHVWRAIELGLAEDYEARKMNEYVPETRRLENPVVRQGEKRDPMKLPDSITGTILGLLDDKTLPSLMRVCKRWEYAVLNNSNFLRSPEFKQFAGVRHVNSFIGQCAKIGLTHCKQMYIWGLPGDELATLNALIDSGLQIDCFGFELESEDQLYDFLQSSEPARKFLKFPSTVFLCFDMVSNVSTINRILAEFKGVKQLRIEILCKSPRIGLPIVDTPPTVFPNLEKLEITGSAQRPTLMYCVLAGLFRRNIFPALKEFETEWGVGILDVFEPIFSPTLKSLSMSSDDNEDSFDDLIKMLNKHNVKLEKFHLAQCFRAEDIKRLDLSVFSSLQSFTTYDLPLARDEVVRIVKATNGNLTEFGHQVGIYYPDLEDIPEDVYYKSVIEGCPHLKKFSTDFNDDHHQSCRLLRAAFEGSSAAQSLEEVNFWFANIDDEGLRIFLGQKGSFPRLRRIRGLRKEVSSAMVKALREQWGFVVDVVSK